MEWNFYTCKAFSLHIDYIHNILTKFKLQFTPWSDIFNAAMKLFYSGTKKYTVEGMRLHITRFYIFQLLAWSEGHLLFLLLSAVEVRLAKIPNLLTMHAKLSSHMRLYVIVNKHTCI